MTTQTPIAGIAVANANDSEADLENSYFAELQKQANQAVSSIYNVSVTPISTAGVGGFNYIWESPDLQFNQDTFNYINQRVVPGTPAAQLSDPISTDYDHLLQRITFQYSQKDQQTINQAQTTANQQSTAIVSQYSTTYKPITQEMLSAAGVQTHIDYIIQYVVAQQWSGTLTSKQPPLSLTQMEQARNLSSLLPYVPPSGANLLPAITQYLSLLSSVLPLQQLSMNANWMLQQLKTNTEHPSSTNGGITTVNGNDGTTAEHVGYAIPVAVTAIQNDLSNTARVIQVQMAASQSSQNTLSVSVAQSADVTVPLDWFLSLSGGEESSQYNLFSFQGTGTDVSISMSFAGFSWVPVEVAQFQEDTVSGWMSAQVLAQAAQNQGQDITGLAFFEPTGFDLGAGGNFGMLTGVLISNYPTFTMTYAHGDYSTFQESFQEQSSWNVSFLGISIASFSQSRYQATSQQNSTSGGFTVTFAPSTETLNVPDLQKQAYVIGGSIAYPGTGSL